MPRVSFATIDTVERRASAESIIAERGSLLDLYRILLHSPSIASGWLNYLNALRFKSSLSPVLRELVILRIAQLNKAAYEAHHHLPIALSVGVSQAKLDVLEEWAQASVFDDPERAVLDYADSMTRDVQVPADVFAAVRRHLGDTDIVELTATIATYNMVSRFLEALSIHSSDRRGAAPAQAG